MIVQSVARAPVRRILRSRRFDASLAEDVLQEVVLRMAADDYCRLRGFRGDSEQQLRAFLRTTAVRLARDLLRKWERTRRHEAQVGGDWPEVSGELTDEQVPAVLKEWESSMSQADLLRFRRILAAEGLAAEGLAAEGLAAEGLAAEDLAGREEPTAQRRPASARTLRRWKVELFQKYFRRR